jgi:dynein heavy chain
VVDWWAASVKLLQNPKLLSEMKNYDKDAMEERLV